MNKDRWHQNSRNKSKPKPSGVILPPMGIGKNLELNNLKTIGSGQDVSSRNTPLAGDKFFPRSAKNAINPASSISPHAASISSTPRSPKQQLSTGNRSTSYFQVSPLAATVQGSSRISRSRP